MVLVKFIYIYIYFIWIKYDEMNRYNVYIYMIFLYAICFITIHVIINEYIDTVYIIEKT